MGFTKVHMDDEQDARDRGLIPHKVRLLITVKSIKDARLDSGTEIVITCERKDVATSSNAKKLSGCDAEEKRIGAELEFFAVFARRACPETSALEACVTRPNTTQLDGFESFMAQITVRENNADGPVRNCAAVDLAKHACGKQNLCDTVLDLQLGGTMSISIDCTIIDEGESATELESGVSRNIYAAVANFVDDNVSCCTAENREDSLSEMRQPEGIGATLTSSPSQINYDSSSEDEKGTGEEENTSLRLERLISKKEYADEYTTRYAGGAWKEAPLVAVVNSPRKLVFWSIDGPDESDTDDDDYDDDDDDMEDEDGGRVSKPMRQKSTMTVSTTEPGPPAEVGKLSRLQKFKIQAVGSLKPYVIELGAPISISKSCVLRVTNLLANDVRYIDEPILSDSDSEAEVSSSGSDSESEEDSRSERLSQEEGEGSFKRRVSSCSDESAEEEKVNRLGRETSKITVLPPKTGYTCASSSSLARAESISSLAGDNGEGLCRETLPGDDDEDSLATGILRERSTKLTRGASGRHKDAELAEMMFQVEEFKRYVQQLQGELRAALEKEGALSRALSEARGEEEGAQDSRMRLEQKSMRGASTSRICESFLTTSEVTEESFGELREVRRLRQELDDERTKRDEAERENRRLLDVILMLKGELDQELSNSDSTKELRETKKLLSTERKEKKKLEEKISKLSRTSKENKGEKKKGGFFGIGGSKGKSGRALKESSQKKKESNSAVG